MNARVNMRLKFSMNSATEYLLRTLPLLGFPSGSDGKESACSVGDLGSITGSGRSPEKRMATTSVFLPVECHGQRNLVSYSP